MGFLGRLGNWLKSIFKKKHLRIGIYGPPNAGKTTLANRISKDWTGELIGTVSEIPHETRKASEKKQIVIEAEGSKVTFDIIDTPGIATKIDFHNFVEAHSLDENEARSRAKEATEGVIEAIKWLDNVDGVRLIMDASEDPFTQVNVTIIGNLEARDLPILIVANKIDLENSSPATIKTAFPQHSVIPLSALTGYNMENLYRTMVKYFR
jgi:small GTP-binding protein